MIETAYLTELATKISTDTTKVLINNAITINSFDVEQITGTTYELIFTVTSGQTTLIENIKLQKTDNTVISDNDVSIPISTNEIQIRQTILVDEVTG